MQYFKGWSILPDIWFAVLCVRWRTYVNKVVMNFVKHCCLLNELIRIIGNIDY